MYSNRVNFIEYVEQPFAMKLESVSQGTPELGHRSNWKY